MHLHMFSDPLSATEPHKRRCSACGEPQVYRPPSGKGTEFTDVLVDKGDLRDLIASYRGQAAMDCPFTDALCDRLELLLDPQRD